MPNEETTVAEVKAAKGAGTATPGAGAAPVTTKASGIPAAQQNGGDTSRLIELFKNQGGKWFHDETTTSYVSVEINGYVETWPIKSKAFLRWLKQAYYTAHKSPPTQSGVEEAITILDGWGLYEGP